MKNTQRKFEVGDPVYHMGFGIGEISQFDDSDVEYPITVKFQEGDLISFTEDGKYSNEENNPTLLHADVAHKMGLVKNIPRKLWFIVEKNETAPCGVVLSRAFETEKEALEATVSDEQVVALVVRV